MPLNMTPESASVSEDWQLAADDVKSPSLVVALRRSAHIFPWFRFAYAEGDNSLVKIAFATHVVTVSGHGLAALLADLAGQRVSRIIQPTENEAKFGVRGPGSVRQSGPGITDISVEAIQ